MNWHPAWQRGWLVSVFCWSGLVCQAQDNLSSLELVAVQPGGVRLSATQSWASYDIRLLNPTDKDRLARVILFYRANPDARYGRDVWVPARSALTTWVLTGPAPVAEPGKPIELQSLLYERTDGTDVLIRPRGEENLRTRTVYTRKREPSTTLILDEPLPSDLPPLAELPQPSTRAEDVVNLVTTIRGVNYLSEVSQQISTRSLPPTPEAMAGVDHIVLASSDIRHDPVGLQALRQWLHQGGKIWIMLDLVEPEAVAALLGETLDFQIVDRVSLMSTDIKETRRREGPVEQERQDHAQPVDMVRVLLSPEDRVRHTVDGWPAWFVRRAGRGKVVFTTLSARGWVRPRLARDPKSPFPSTFPNLPVALNPLQDIATELHPPEENLFQSQVFPAALAEEIGYNVVHRGTAITVFALFFLVVLLLGVFLHRSGRGEWLGWLMPGSALVSAGVFLWLGQQARQAVPSTIAEAQIVDAIPGVQEASVHGMLALYQPESGPLVLGVTAGGLIEPDSAGLEGKSRTLLTTDLGNWRWDNVAVPAGVRLAPYRTVLPTPAPITARTRVVANGLEGQLSVAPFTDIRDAILVTPTGRNLSVQVKPDGQFQIRPGDELPSGQFLAETVLTDEQQRRQQLYRALLSKRPEANLREGRQLLLAWAKPAATSFQLAENARRTGLALLCIPLEVEAPAPGTRVTYPGAMIPCRRFLRNDFVPLPRDGTVGTEMDIRFELPPVLRSLTLERARLSLKLSAPGRTVTLAPWDERAGQRTQVSSPLDPIRVEWSNEAFLRSVTNQQLRVRLTISDAVGQEKGQASSEIEKWVLDYLELELTGTVANP